MYEYTVRGMYVSHCYINTVGVVDWVCMVLDRKVWKASLDMVMSLQVV